MIVAGRVSQKMARCCARSTTRWPNPKWVLAMGVCASSGGMFNNYAIVQGVDHVVPVDMYLPGCPPRPEMLIDAILQAARPGAARPSSAATVPARSSSSRPPRSSRCPPREMKGLFDDDESDHNGHHAGERAPAPTGEVAAVGVRHGMFGVTAPVTPAATAAWSPDLLPR